MSEESFAQRLHAWVAVIDPRMGLFSVKSVHPALILDKDSQNYHNLDERCQNGGNAMTLFPRFQFMEPEETVASRETLLCYCELDTWAI